MKVETMQSFDAEQDMKTAIDPAMPAIIGRTVFEALAIQGDENDQRGQLPDGSQYMVTITRLGDGQTVPDDR